MGALTFQDFAFASERAMHAHPDDHLIVQDQIVASSSKNSTYESSDVHRKTWSAFSRAVREAFTEDRIKWICDRYKFKLDSYSTHPLQRRYVEYFGVGSYSTRLSDLADSLYSQSWTISKIISFFWSTKVSSCSVNRVRDLYNHATSNSYLGAREDPRDLSGAPRKVHENFIEDKFTKDRQRCNLFQGISEMVSTDPKIPRLHPYYSRLNMTITCLVENSSGVEHPEFIIPAPGPTDGEIDFYRVYDVISEGGLTAVALVPVSDSSPLKPLISFRCTKQAFSQKDFMPSILNNGEGEMGRSGYQLCKDKLIALIEDPKFTRGRKATVLAYSQGGGHAGYFLNDILGTHWRKIGEFVGFNFIGNDNPVIEGIADKINAIPADELPPAFTIHRNIGDWVNGSGRKHVGWGFKHPNSIVRVFEWKIDDYKMPTKNPYDPTQFDPWHNLHGARPMDSRREYEYDFYQGPAQCNPILDTYKRDPTLEDIRQKLGHQILYRVVGFFYHSIDFILRLFGIEYFKKKLFS